MSGEPLLPSFHELMASVNPPRFDRIAVSDLRPFAHIPRRDATGTLGHGLPLALLGIPVVEDERVEVGVIELRKRVLVEGEWRDDVVDRIYLSELRA